MTSCCCVKIWLPVWEVSWTFSNSQAAPRPGRVSSAVKSPPRGSTRGSGSRRTHAQTSTATQRGSWSFSASSCKPRSQIITAAPLSWDWTSWAAPRSSAAPASRARSCRTPRFCRFASASSTCISAVRYAAYLGFVGLAVGPRLAGRDRLRVIRRIIGLDQRRNHQFSCLFVQNRHEPVGSRPGLPGGRGLVWFSVEYINLLKDAHR